jgi:hypothetical protein
MPVATAAATITTTATTFARRSCTSTVPGLTDRMGVSPPSLSTKPGEGRADPFPCRLTATTATTTAHLQGHLREARDHTIDEPRQDAEAVVAAGLVGVERGELGEDLLLGGLPGMPPGSLLGLSRLDPAAAAVAADVDLLVLALGERDGDHLDVGRLGGRGIWGCPLGLRDSPGG